MEVSKTSPLAPLLAKERGTRKSSGSPSPCKEKGLGDVVHFSFHVTPVNTTNNDSYGNNGTSLYTAGLNGNSGSVTLEAYGDIITNEIRTASDNNGNGGIVKLTSQTGRIDTHGGQILTHANNGNAGNVTLKSVEDIKVGNIVANSRNGGVATTGVWKGGKVTLETDGNIETGNITTTSITGNAGNVTLKANLGTSATGNLGIKVGNIDAFANGDGNAGDVKLTAGFDSDINVLAIKTNVGGNGKGDGGEAYITGGGNIVVDSVRADSIGGKAGNIRLIASKTVRVTSAFSVNGESYSIYTDSVDDASGAKGGTVTIQHGSTITNLLSPFVVGDASVNGTFAGVSDGTFGFVTTSGVHIFAGKSNFAGLHIWRADVVAQNFLPSWEQVSGSVRVLLDKFYPLLTYNAISLVKPIDQLLSEYLSLGLPGFTLGQLTQIGNIGVKEVDNNGNVVTAQRYLDKENAQKYLSAMNLSLFAFGLTNKERQAHFISQSLQETLSFVFLTEDIQNIPKPEYYPYIGRGLLHLTWDYNYEAFAKAFGLSVKNMLDNPKIVANDSVLAALSAVWYWNYSVTGNLNAIADANQSDAVLKISRGINTGSVYSNITPNGLEERESYFAKAKIVLGL